MKYISIILVALFAFSQSVLGGAFSDEEKASSFSAKEVSKPAVPVSQSAPHLPEDLQSASGNVIVAFIIGDDGSVVAPRVLKTENESLNEHALSCVATWAFEPAQKDGSSVAMRAMVKVRFAQA
jgi:TonB family protein